MNRVLLSILFGLSVLMVATSPGHAQRVNDRQKAPQLAGTANLIAPYAQAIAHVNQSGVIISAQGVKSVTNPSLGQYCIELKVGIVAKTAPTVSVDWSFSGGNGLLAYWRSSNTGCPGATRRTINIATYTFSGGSAPVLSNSVSFVVTVP